ncbi:hypothetical protein BJX76DRAFT_357780 [Aspergillus varians]
MATPAAPSQDYYGGHGPGVVGVSIFFCCVATILIALRIYTYAVLVRNKGGWALVWAVVAWGLGLASTVLYCLAAKYGLGNHQSIVATAPHIDTALLFEWIAANTIYFSIAFAKISILMFILQVQGNANRFGKWLLIVVVTVNFICYIITVPINFVQCSPTRKLWQQTIPGNCDGVDRAFYWATFTGAWGTMADFLLACYPGVMIWNLKLRLRLKLTISILMGLGLVTGVCSLIKTIEFGRLRAVKDATYAIAPLMIYGMTEMWVVLIASSGAPLWPLARHVARWWRRRQREQQQQQQEQRWKNGVGNWGSNRVGCGSKDGIVRSDEFIVTRDLILWNELWLYTYNVD